MKKLLNAKGQMNIESIITMIVLLIVYIIAASYVFKPVFDIMSPTLENTSGSYGSVASTIVLVLVYIIIPILLISSATMLLRPRVEQV
jgi:amino acid transporter